MNVGKQLRQICPKCQSPHTEGIAPSRENPTAVMRCATCGHVWTPSAPSVRATLATLSPREGDVLRQLAEAKTNREIAEALGLREYTVRNYLARIFEKTGASNRLQLALRYRHLAHRDTDAVV